MHQHKTRTFRNKRTNAAITETTQDDHEIVKVYPAKPLQQKTSELVVPTNAAQEETPIFQTPTFQTPTNLSHQGIKQLRNRLSISKKTPNKISSARTENAVVTTSTTPTSLPVSLPVLTIRTPQKAGATTVSTIETVQRTNPQPVSNVVPQIRSAASVLGGVLKPTFNKSVTAQAPVTVPPQPEQNQPEQNQPEQNQPEANPVPQQASPNKLLNKLPYKTLINSKLQHRQFQHHLITHQVQLQRRQKPAF
ncbi:MAG: hypothetical protein HC908_17530 [Calothrix sp. SM1_7_51]|nr:hypothetical protein [Calothrix sp. SM1_7_51]